MVIFSHKTVHFMFCYIFFYPLGIISTLPFTFSLKVFVCFNIFFAVIFCTAQCSCTVYMQVRTLHCSVQCTCTVYTQVCTVHSTVQCTCTVYTQVFTVHSTAALSTCRYAPCTACIVYLYCLHAGMYCT